MKIEFRTLKELKDRVSDDRIRSYLEEKARREIAEQEFIDRFWLLVRLKEEEYEKSGSDFCEVAEAFMHPDTFEEFDSVEYPGFINRTDISLIKYGCVAYIEEEDRRIRLWVDDSVEPGEILFYSMGDPETRERFPEKVSRF